MAQAADFEHIIHPTDFSAESRTAFAHAVRLGVAAKGYLTVIHCARDGRKAGAEWEKFPKVREQLSDWGMLPKGAPREAVYDDLGLHVVKADLGYPEPAHGIAKYVGTHACDLLVLGNHGREGMDAWFSGSISSDLAREANKPALFVPTNGAGFVDLASGDVTLKTILIPVDGDIDPGMAVALTNELVHALGAEGVTFHFLHVGDAEPSVVAPGMANVERHVKSGPVVQTILDMAKEIDADLIVMPTEGRQGFLDALRGSTTEQVLRHSHRALLAVPA